MLELLAVVVLDVVPEYLVRLGLGALALPIVGVGIVVLVLAPRYPDFGDANVLARQVVLVYDCNVEHCGLLDGLGARLGKSVQRWCNSVAGGVSIRVAPS